MPTSQSHVKANDIALAPRRKVKIRRKHTRPKADPFASIRAAKSPKDLGEKRVTKALRLPPLLVYDSMRYIDNHETNCGQKINFTDVVEAALREQLKRPMPQDHGINKVTVPHPRLGDRLRQLGRSKSNAA
jgi:hypothetical protein